MRGKEGVPREYLNDILETMADPLIVVEPDACIRSVNRATCELLEYRAEELIGKRIDKILEAGGGAAAAADRVFRGIGLQKLMEHGHIRNIEMCLRSKSSKEIPVLLSASVLTDENGKMTGIICAAKDITERKRAEAKLAKILADFRQLNYELALDKRNLIGLVTKNVDGMIIVDSGGKVVFANPAALHLFGRKEGNFVGSDFGIPIVAREYVDIDIVRVNGEAGFGEMHVAETEWEGKPAHLIVVRDATEKKRVAERIEREREEARAKEQAMVESLPRGIILTNE